MRFLSKLGLARVAPPRRYAEDLSSTAPMDRFLATAQHLPASARVVEFGTRQSKSGHSTHMHHALPNIPRANYLMTDVQDGEDVDVTADLHALPRDWAGRFDAVIALAVFEHLERPWIAAAEVSRILAPGGVGYIQTHQTFPLHGYPSDFFRFSREALSLIFADAKLRVVEAAYLHRADIVPPTAIVPTTDVLAWNDLFPSYLSVHVFVEKAPATPGDT
ncbi:methyltransferase domain-containing protein [Methylobacterium brachythecii]|uniref:SAM-dependent methyltransferase n=1 Tax=Methylobacterium brachythecii TaxID=1176177 RepID=A0A7W6AFF9_9HYPH|nr:methyltransferase domain-containing protein [Methylobacterium brachythecii]MBB3902333.1 SAM-dependent methyltransferase [Methylobacterium brachythecii]GLS42182.1 hypothetical protein GCM10007884_01670 [Methylobacterium brachythecii]